jgi:ribonucleoside-diphosphate reductase alpha chain
MNAGVGILGLAHLMAKKNLKYDTVEGRNFAHELGETHYWHLVKASLRISKEIGTAPWMHKTYWPEGWNPLKTYNRNVDELVTVGPKRDWAGLTAEIVANGGIAHSVLCAHMPGESSTIAAGTTNGPYPIRDTSLSKTNDTNALAWVAPDATTLKDRYQRAWDIHPDDMLKFYAVLQKWCDQSISADLWRRLQGAATVGTKEIIRTFLTMWKYGVKTRYYFNLLTGKSVNLNSENPDSPAPDAVQSPEPQDDQAICESCAL